MQGGTYQGTEKIYERYGSNYYLDTAERYKMTLDESPITLPEKVFTVIYNYNNATGGNSNLSAQARYAF